MNNISKNENHQLYSFTFQLPTKGKFSTVSLWATDEKEAIGRWKAKMGDTPFQMKPYNS